MRKACPPRSYYEKPWGTYEVKRQWIQHRLIWKFPRLKGRIERKRNKQSLKHWTLNSPGQVNICEKHKEGGEIRFHPIHSQFNPFYSLLEAFSDRKDAPIQTVKSSLEEIDQRHVQGEVKGAEKLKKGGKTAKRRKRRRKKRKAEVLSNRTWIVSYIISLASLVPCAIIGLVGESNCYLALNVDILDMNLEIVHEALGRSRLAGLNDTDVMVYVIDNLSVDTTRKPLPPSASSPPASLTQPPTFASTPSSSPVAALPYLALGVGPTTTPSTPSRENGVKEYDGYNYNIPDLPEYINHCLLDNAGFSIQGSNYLNSPKIDLEIVAEADKLRAEKAKFEAQWELLHENKEKLREEAEYITEENKYLSTIPCGGIKVSITGRNTHLLVTLSSSHRTNFSNGSPCGGIFLQLSISIYPSRDFAENQRKNKALNAES
ncbi:hypothetical protein JHK82_018961 [Glycine max]|nr:hypothetical protein JHK82_018961 [Glycine max]